LRIFLKGHPKDEIPGEITEYKGVEIEWIRGKKAVMTIYEDGVKKEDIELYKLETREQMHKLMQDKGFEKKTQEDKLAEIQAVRREKQLKQVGEGSSFYGQLLGIYFMVIVAVLGVGIFVNGRRKSTRTAHISRV